MIVNCCDISVFFSETTQLVDQTKGHSPIGAIFASEGAFLKAKFRAVVKPVLLLEFALVIFLLWIIRHFLFVIHYTIAGLRCDYALSCFVNARRATIKKTGTFQKQFICVFT